MTGRSMMVYGKGESAPELEDASRVKLCSVWPPSCLVLHYNSGGLEL